MVKKSETMLPEQGLKSSATSSSKTPLSIEIGSSLTPAIAHCTAYSYVPPVMGLCSPCVNARTYRASVGQLSSSKIHPSPGGGIGAPPEQAAVYSSRT